MAFFRFTPDLVDGDDLENISVGGNDLVQDCIEGIKNSVRGKSTRQILFLGSRGIGKSHTLLRILHKLSKMDQVTTIRLAEEEYSVSSLDDLCRRILEVLGCPYHDGDATSHCRVKLNDLKRNGKPAVLFVENLQALFGQIRPDLAKLRSIIQSDQSISIVGSALTYFDLVSSPGEPFYRFFDIRRIHGLAEEQVSELIKKRLMVAKKQYLIGPLEERPGRMAGIRLLTGGNPRLIHMWAEAIIQKDSLEDMEYGLLSLLDQLTPLYQARMETMPGEQRRLFDTIALSEGPLSPTEMARRLNISKPASVISQLRRMQRGGLVENVKFSNKRGTRYQIAERLYRIWRELRSVRGAARVKSFIDFMGLWYAQGDPAGKPAHTREGFEWLCPHPKKGAAFVAEKICNIPRTVHNMGIIDLYTAAVRLAHVNQRKDARQEIQKMSDLNKKEKNKMLQTCGDVLISFAKLTLADSKSPGYAGKMESAMNKIDGLYKQRVRIPKGERERGLLFTTCEAITHHLISNEQYERAVHFNDISSACSAGFFCAGVLNQRAKIKALQKCYDESLMLVDEILKQEPGNQEALAGKVFNLTALNRQDLAVKAGRQLLALDGRYFTDALMPFIKFRLEQELLVLIKQHGVLKLEPDRLSDFLKNYVEILTHELLHAIIGKKTDDRRFAISALYSIKDMVKPGDVSGGCAHAVFAHIRMVDALQEMIPVLWGIFGPAKLEGLAPLAGALEYLAGRDPAVLEKMHPEARHLAIDIIQKMSPGITISRKVLDSVSFW